MEKSLPLLQWVNCVVIFNPCFLPLLGSETFITCNSFVVYFFWLPSYGITNYFSAELNETLERSLILITSMCVLLCKMPEMLMHRGAFLLADIYQPVISWCVSKSAFSDLFNLQLRVLRTYQLLNRNLRASLVFFGGDLSFLVTHTVP